MDLSSDKGVTHGVVLIKGAASLSLLTHYADHTMVASVDGGYGTKITDVSVSNISFITELYQKFQFVNVKFGSLNTFSILFKC